VQVARPFAIGTAPHPAIALPLAVKAIVPLGVPELPFTKALKETLVPAVYVYALASMPPETGSDPVACGVDALLKLAVTLLLLPIEIEHMPVPEQSPDHPENVDPEAGAALSVTIEPALKDAEQFEVQARPAGEELTVPLPEIAAESV
jgi:hypothetical protein